MKAGGAKEVELRGRGRYCIVKRWGMQKMLNSSNPDIGAPNALLSQRIMLTYKPPALSF